MNKEVLEKVKADPRYIKNVEYGQPRPGHPEGKVAAHILELENNLENIVLNTTDVELSENDYWKLKFLVHTHDTFKAEAIPDSPITSPNSHASLAKAFASEFTDDADILNMIQFHDESFALFKQWKSKGKYNEERLEKLLSTIKDWHLFLVFLIVDGDTEGKNAESLNWFLDLVKDKLGYPHIKDYLRKR